MSEHTEEIEETETEETTDQANDIIDELEADFQKFKNTKSTHTVESQESNNTNPNNDFIPEDINMVDDFKLQIFLGIFFSLLDGIHVFLYRFISKHDIAKEDLALDSEEQEGLAVYFKTKRILDLINKLPVELIGFVHMEWMYYQKYQEIAKTKEKEEATENRKKLLAEMVKRKKEKQEPEEKKPPVKKRAAKKKPKKRAAKKQVTEDKK